MPPSVTGIDISDEYLTAVQVLKGFGRWELTACARIHLKGEEARLDQGLSTLSQSMNLTGGECIVAISGAETYYRNLTVPFKDKRKQREVLSFELEPNVPFPIDDLVVDFFATNRSDTPELLAFFAEKRMVGRLLETLKTHDIDPEALCVRCIPMALWLINNPGRPDEGVLLDLGEKRVTLVLWQKGRVVFIRTFVQGSGGDCGSRIADCGDQTSAIFNTVRHTLHAFGAGRKDFEPPEKAFLTGPGATQPGVSQFVAEILGIPGQRVDLCNDDRIRLGEHAEPLWDPLLMDGALSLALGRYNAKGLGPNLRKDGFEVQKRSFYRSKIFRKVTAWLLVIAALWAVDMGVDTYFLKQRAAALDSRTRVLFKKTFPHINRIVDPVKQAQIEINELKRVSTPARVAGMNSRALDLFLEISERLPEPIDLKVSRLVIDPHSVRIKGETDTYNTVDRVKQGLEKSPLFKTTTISSANLDQGKNRVLFEIKLGR
ncbi:MAG: PilN domain-containing protein [Deltaproteobacteria bacterium]|nr:PilN domain-containing protein [Deltaproteobacteria bacterium]